MSRCFLHILVVLTAITCSAGSTHGNVTKAWPYDVLVEQSDLVVVATIASSNDSGERVKDELWGTYLGVNVKLDVLVTLKGKEKPKVVTALFFRQPHPEPVSDPPALIAFQPGAEYLLFLKHRADGRFEPVSGNLNAKRSVRKLVPPAEQSDEAPPAVAPEKGQHGGVNS